MNVVKEMDSVMNALLNTFGVKISSHFENQDGYRYKILEVALTIDNFAMMLSNMVSILLFLTKCIRTRI